MKMKFLILCTFIALSAGLVMLYIQNAKITDSKNIFIKELENQENSVWETLEKIGISKEICSQNVPELENYFFENMAMTPEKSPAISQETIDLVKEVLGSFGINTDTIAILPTEQESPAVAGEDVLYINEPFLKSYSAKAQLFILGHEAQHMINKDMFMRNAINNEITEGSTLDWNSSDPESPLNQFLRLCELRADMQAALTNKDFAEGYLEFAQSLIEQDNDQIGICHPKDSERLALAQNICKTLQA